MSVILAKLFGSGDRVKVVRLFLLNPEGVFQPKDIALRAKITPQSTRRETNLLSSIGFIRKKKAFIEVPIKNKPPRKKRIEGWALDFSFSLLSPLKKLVLDTSPLVRRDFLKKLAKVGRLKLVVLAGIFIQREDSRVDILVVGDKIRKNLLETVLKQAEAEIGKDLAYAVFETSDFIYRFNICDKFVRDILDYPHEKLLNRLNI